MARFIQPVALCIVLILGAVPGVTLACEWACNRDAGSRSEPASHHHHATEPDDSAAQAFGSISIVAFDSPCEHVGTAVDAMTAAGVKLLQPLTTLVPRLEFGMGAGSAQMAANPGTHSPPGTRSAPLPLRV